MKHLFEDMVWIVAVATWVPELMRKGIIAPAFGWFIGISFVVSLATSRRAFEGGGSLVWRSLHAGIPITAMISYLIYESGGQWSHFFDAVFSVLPMLLVLAGFYLLIGGVGRKPDD